MIASVFFLKYEYFIWFEIFTSIDELLDAAPVVDEVCALLHGVLHPGPGLAGGGLRVPGRPLLRPEAAPARRAAVAAAHVAPEAGHARHAHHQDTVPAQNIAGQPETYTRLERILSSMAKVGVENAKDSHKLLLMIISNNYYLLYPQSF